MFEVGNSVLPGDPQQILEGGDRDGGIIRQVGAKESLCLLVSVPMEVQVILDLDESALFDQMEEDRLGNLPVPSRLFEGRVRGRGLESSLLVKGFKAVVEGYLCWGLCAVRRTLSRSWATSLASVRSVRSCVKRGAGTRLATRLRSSSFEIPSRRGCWA